MYIGESTKQSLVTKANVHYYANFLDTDISNKLLV
jgi:hypothetical protein